MPGKKKAVDPAIKGDEKNAKNVVARKQYTRDKARTSWLLASLNSLFSIFPFVEMSCATLFVAEVACSSVAVAMSSRLQVTGKKKSAWREGIYTAHPLGE